MKRLFLAAAVLLAAVACSQKQAVDVYIPKGSMEFAGNGFETFSLGSDVRLYMSPDADDASKWLVQAVVPVKKEVEGILTGLSMDMTLLDDKGVRVRDSFVLEAEDIEALVPVFNSADNVERTVVFSAPEDAGKKLFTYKEAKQLVESVKNIRFNINAEKLEPKVEEEIKEEDAVPEDEKPYTFKWLCKRMNVNAVLARYDRAVSKGDKRLANEIEAELYAIEKQVKEDKTLPESLSKRFISYVEDRIETIDEKY